MIKVNIRPLSINECFQGRRYHTEKYKKYARDLMFILPKITVPIGKIQIDYEFGISSKLADIDNPVKGFTDILQKKYKFNDRQIYKMNLIKVDVPKGQEYIKFEFKQLEE